MKGERTMALSALDASEFIDRDFGPDPYFDAKKASRGLDYGGDQHLIKKHLEYMLRIMWPLLASYRLVIVGQRAMTTYTALGQIAVGDRNLDYLGAGHVLYEDFPGKGKTLLAKVPAIVLGGTYGRLQGDPEKTPTDFTGNRILDIDENGRRFFKLVRGPLFADILLVDEVNRLSAETMSALLQCLSEGKLTIFDETHEMRQFGLFTMNPIETEGTRKLLEALVDRIMFKITGEWFTAKQFAEILERTNNYDEIRRMLKQVCGIQTVHEIREFFHQHIYVDPDLRLNYMGRFTEISNDPHRFGCLMDLGEEFKEPVVKSGLSGRGIAHWEGAAKALAAFRYRSYVREEDLLKVLLPILRLRIKFTPGAVEHFMVKWMSPDPKKSPDKNATIDRIIRQLIKEAW